MHDHSSNDVRFVLVHIMGRTQTLGELDVRVLGLELLRVGCWVDRTQRWIRGDDDDFRIFR